MFENIIKFFKKFITKEENEQKSKDQAKERLHLVLMQDRSNMSYDFLDLMKQEIIEVIKKYIEVDEELIDVRLTNEISEDSKTGCPTLYANIPISKIKEYNTHKKDTNQKLNSEKNKKADNTDNVANKTANKTIKKEQSKKVKKNQKTNKINIKEKPQLSKNKSLNNIKKENVMTNNNNNIKNKNKTIKQKQIKGAVKQKINNNQNKNKHKNKDNIKTKTSSTKLKK